MAVITAQDLQVHLGIDIVDEQIMTNLTNAVDTACRWLPAAVGKDFDEADPRAKQLALMAGADFYESRGMTNTPGAEARRFAHSLKQQLWVEGLKEGKDG